MLSLIIERTRGTSDLGLESVADVGISGPLPFLSIMML